MRGNKRRAIPKSAEEETLFNADHTCCICRQKNKDVQIHHIDGNTSNNHLDNLAVVCLDCHSRVSGTAGLGKCFKPGEVRRYKRAWDKQVRDSRGLHRPRIYYKKELISQIDVIVCEVLACSKNKVRQEELLGVLSELHLWRGSKEIDSKIIEGLSHLAVMGGLNSAWLTRLVSEKLWEMCFHFVGPRLVPMGRDGLARVLQCLDILQSLADFACGYCRGVRATESIAKTAENFFELALWYSKKKVARAVVQVYRSGLGSCVFQDKNEFPEGAMVLKKSLRRIQRMLRDGKASWKDIGRPIADLLRPSQPSGS